MRSKYLTYQCGVITFSQRSTRVAATATLVLLPMLLISGCGGGTNEASSGPATGFGQVSQATSGRASFTVRWPEPSRLIPFAAKSILVRLTRENALLGERLLVRPENGGETSVVFDALPTGDAVATATAFPNPDGTGVAQAHAQMGFTVMGGQTVPVRLTMGSTITRLDVAPTNLSLSLLPGGINGQFSATAKNSAGEVVLTHSSTIQWRSLNPAVASVDATGKVTALAAGTGSIEAKEAESGMVATAGVTVTGPAGTGNIRIVDLKVNDIIYDPVRQTIHASVPSSVGTSGNSIRSLNPVSLALGAAVFVGSEPGKLAISDNAQYLYVSLDGTAAVRRIDIATQTPGLQFTLGSQNFGGSYFVEDMEVMPGNPDVIAVSRRNIGFSPRHEGVAIYDNGVARPKTTPDHTGSNVIEFSNSAGRLYGYNNETTEFGFRRMNVDASGVVTQDVADSFNSNLISGFSTDIEYDNGRIYATSGRVIDPEARTLLGTFQASGLVRPDSTLNRVFFLTGNFNNFVIKAFNPSTFLEVGSIAIPGVSGTPRRLIRWGEKGLAFSTDAGKVYIITVAPGT